MPRAEGLVGQIRDVCATDACQVPAERTVRKVPIEDGFEQRDVAVIVEGVVEELAVAEGRAVAAAPGGAVDRYGGAEKGPPLRLGRRGLLARDGLLRERSGRRDQREREADEDDPGAHCRLRRRRQKGGFPARWLARA